MNKTKTKSILITLCSIIILVLIAIVIFIKSIPTFRYPTPNPKTKACMRNIRIITGAIEMYNFDRSSESEMIHRIDLELLYNKGYLKEKIQNSTNKCKYLSEGDLVKDGYIYCAEHGDLEQKYKITQESKY